MQDRHTHMSVQRAARLLLVCLLCVAGTAEGAVLCLVSPGHASIQSSAHGTKCAQVCHGRDGDSPSEVLDVPLESGTNAPCSAVACVDIPLPVLAEALPASQGSASREDGVRDVLPFSSLTGASGAEAVHGAARADLKIPPHAVSAPPSRGVDILQC